MWEFALGRNQRRYVYIWGKGIDYDILQRIGKKVLKTIYV